MSGIALFRFAFADAFFQNHRRKNTNRTIRGAHHTHNSDTHKHKRYTTPPQHLKHIHKHTTHKAKHIHEAHHTHTYTYTTRYYCLKLSRLEDFFWIGYTFSQKLISHLSLSLSLSLSVPERRRDRPKTCRFWNGARARAFLSIKFFFLCNNLYGLLLYYFSCILFTSTKHKDIITQWKRETYLQDDNNTTKTICCVVQGRRKGREE